ncbi:hypothetical protein FRB95_013752 [Tulasnella sp. JGI-2019a]|nr:hypothetical protein FRB95_013752 [Tulasnella sp. JGI-2019a]
MHLLFISLTCLAAITKATFPIPTELYSPVITEKVLNTAHSFASQAPKYPHYTTPPPYNNKAGQWQYYPPAGSWTSGFFPATLMLLAERATKCPGGQLVSLPEAESALTYARTWSAPLSKLTKINGIGHDVGFISFPFQDDLHRNPGSVAAQATVNAFAAFLAGRYSPVVGCTRSWDVSTPNYFQVIMDNMINIDIFFMANENSTVYRNMAISHADRTIKNHVRADGSTFHMVIYSSRDGTVTARKTAQGYADNSTWMRGQA